MSDDEFEIAEWRPECDEFTLKHVEGSDTLESVFKRLNFRKTRHVLFDVAYDLSVVDLFGLKP